MDCTTALNSGALVQQAPDCDWVQGLVADILACGYTGVIPTQPRFTIPAFPGTERRDTIYDDGFGLLTWKRPLSREQMEGRRAQLAGSSGDEDATLLAHWFRNDRRKIVAKAVERMGQLVSMGVCTSLALDLGRLAVDALLCPDADIGELSRTLSEQEH